MFYIIYVGIPLCPKVGIIEVGDSKAKKLKLQAMVLRVNNCWPL